MRKYYDIALPQAGEELVKVTEYALTEDDVRFYLDNDAEGDMNTACDQWMYESVSLEWAGRMVPNLVLDENQYKELKKKLLV